MTPRKPSRPPQRSSSQTARPKATNEEHQDNSRMAGKHALRIIALGGLEGVGERNCTIYEYGNDILVVDMGFAFPSENMPGIDYVIPDVRYLEERKHKIRGILITHGHMDHIGALPYVLAKIGDPPIYTLPLSAQLIERRLEEFDMLSRTKIHRLGADDEINLGAFNIRMFRVNHNIPDNVGFAIKTPTGLVVHTGDWKFDQTPVGEKPSEIDKLALLGREGVKLLLTDSTSAHLPGHSISEKEIANVIDGIFRDTDSRIIFASFASLISRIQEVLNVAAKHNRKVVLTGRGMIQTFEAGIENGYIKPYPKQVVTSEQAKRVPDNQLVVLTTGGQGEEFSALARMSRGEHRDIDVKAGDTVVISASVIPGNERSVQTMMSNLTRLGAKVIYQKILDIHTGGHAKAEEHKLMFNLIKPKYVLPIHGEHFMLVHLGELANTMGVPKENVFLMDNGQVLEMTDDSARVTSERVPSDLIFVDGLGVGDVGEVVLRDRQAMAEDGMVVFIITINKHGGKLAAPPDIISRGFVHMKSSEDLLREMRHEVRKIVEGKPNKKLEPNWAFVRNEVRDKIGDFLYKRTERRPMILPVIIEV